MVPVYLLDTNLSKNAPEDRRLTDTLYGGDSAHRFRQEVVLGISGVRMLHGTPVKKSSPRATAAVEKSDACSTEVARG